MSIKLIAVVLPSIWFYNHVGRTFGNKFKIYVLVGIIPLYYYIKWLEKANS